MFAHHPTHWLFHILPIRHTVHHQRDGALLIFEVSDRTVVEAFARDDPYVTNRLVGSWTVRPWTVVVGDQRAPAAQVGAPQ